MTRARIFLCVACCCALPTSLNPAPLSASSYRAAALSLTGKVNAAPDEPQAVFPETRFEFGEVESGAVVEHDFVLKNAGSAPLLIEKVSMTPPLLATRMPREVAPGAQGVIHFRLDTSNLAGKFEGTIVLFLNDPAAPQAVWSFTGRIIPAVELSPMAAFFVAGQRGQGGRGVLEIVNHEAATLTIDKIEHPLDRFTTQFATVQPGQRYRLTLILKPDGPGGRALDTILIRTSSQRAPVLKVAANTYLFERVHIFPDVVDFGRLRLADAPDEAITVMVYEEGGSNFQVKLTTDVPSLDMKWERGPMGDRYQATIRLRPEKIQSGPFKGFITISTNDPEFPTIVVPVYGEVLGP